jgi:hypothetical protein
MAMRQIRGQGPSRPFSIDFPADFRIWLNHLTPAVRAFGVRAEVDAKPRLTTLKRVPGELDRAFMCAAARTDPSEPRNAALV